MLSNHHASSKRSIAARASSEPRISARCWRSRRRPSSALRSAPWTSRRSTRSGSVSIDPYAHETQEERGERFERAAEGMRNAFTEEDWVVIDGARMRNLR
jgi:hypothetical protein